MNLLDIKLKVASNKKLSFQLGPISQTITRYKIQYLSTYKIQNLKLEDLLDTFFFNLINLLDTNLKIQKPIKSFLKFKYLWYKLNS